MKEFDLNPIRISENLSRSVLAIRDLGAISKTTCSFTCLVFETEENRVAISERDSYFYVEM